MPVTCIADFWGKEIDLNAYMKQCVRDFCGDLCEELEPLRSGDGILPPGEYVYADLMRDQRHYREALSLGHRSKIAMVITHATISKPIYLKALAVDCILDWIEIERRTDTAEIKYGVYEEALPATRPQIPAAARRHSEAAARRHSEAATAPPMDQDDTPRNTHQTRHDDPCCCVQ